MFADDRVLTVRFDLPTMDNESQPWWDAAAEHRYLIKRCNACGQRYWYPREFCPACWSEDTAWEEASGRGTLYTYSVVYRNDLPPWGDRVPYAPAIVDLDEGPRVMARVVDCDHADLEVGMPVEVTFQEDEEGGFTLPVFRPVS